MRELAVVKELEGDIVLLEKARTEACSTCGSKNGCSVSLSEKKVTIKAMKNGVEVHSGDTVEIDTGNVSATRVSMIVYGIPLAVFLVTLIAINTILGSEVLALGAAFASIVVVYALIALYDKKNREKLMPKIIRKVELPDGFIVR